MSSSSSSDIDGYFGFKPNKGLEIAAITIYTLLTLAVLFLNIRKRTWFMMAIVVGGALEILGFGARIWETDNYNSEGGYILYLVPVLVAPTVLAAANYSLASIIMKKANIRVRFFRPNVTKYLFLVCDILAFFIQGAGGSIAASAKTKSKQDFGSNVVLGGLALSLIVFVVFLILSFSLHLKIRHQPKVRWMRVFYVVYVNMLCLSIRAIYRVAEFEIKPYHNKLNTHEAYFYTLDVLLMMILIFTWIPFHPSFLGLSKHDEENEVVTPGVPMKQTTPQTIATARPSEV